MRGQEDHARRIGLYVDRLIAAGTAAQDAVSDAFIDPASRAAARRLRMDLVRVHPSFRFEEDLAAKLLAAAERNRDGETAEARATDSEAAIIRIPIAPPDGLVAEPNGLVDESDGLVAESEDLVVASPARRRLRAARPYIVGGVAASAAALSIGAFVAWRASRPGSLAVPIAAASASAAASAAATAAASAAAASAAAASGKIAIAAQPPLHRGRGSAVTRGSAVIHGILGVVY